MRQREQYDTFLEEQKYVVWGLFIECHTEKQGATKFHIRAAARDASLMKILQITSQMFRTVSQDYYTHGFFQTVPTCLIDTYSCEEAGNRKLGLSPTPSGIADLQRHIFLIMFQTLRHH